MDENGTKVFDASYDAWGRQTVTLNTIGLHRGYTGHEMLMEFDIINMNGRLYDPVLADAFVEVIGHCTHEYTLCEHAVNLVVIFHSLLHFFSACFCVAVSVAENDRMMTIKIWFGSQANVDKNKDKVTYCLTSS